MKSYRPSRLPLHIMAIRLPAHEITTYRFPVIAFFAQRPRLALWLTLIGLCIAQSLEGAL